MTLTELRYIVALDEKKNFRRAAEACHVSQPTLSTAVKKLEQELDLALFERSRVEVRPTAAGARIVEQARVVLRESRELRELAESLSDPLASLLRLGAIYTVGPYLFPTLVEKLRAAAPGMPLYIEEGYTAVLRRQLRDGELDAIIVALPFTEPDVLTRALYDEPFMVLLPASHPLAGQAQVEPGALAGQRTMLLGEGHCFRDQVLAACPGLAETMATDSGLTEGSSLETLKHMVAGGMGLTVLPRTAVDEVGLAARGLVARPFAGEAPQRTLALAWRASFTRPQVIDLLCDAALAAV